VTSRTVKWWPTTWAEVTTKPSESNTPLPRHSGTSTYTTEGATAANNSAGVGEFADLSTTIFS